MGILRTDKISGLETSTAVTGSVVFDGTGDYLTVAASNDFDFGTNDFTMEFWVSSTKTGRVDPIGWNYIYTSAGWAGMILNISPGSGSWNDGSWHHIAVTRSGNSVRMFLDGTQIGSTYTTSHSYGAASSGFIIGTMADPNTGSGPMDGHISNLRLLKGTVLYTSDFTPPVHELQPIGDTVLLCCNNSDSAGAEGTGKAISIVGNAAASTFSPGLTRDFTYGTEFQGVTVFDTQGYFVPPSGTTTDRDRTGGRGVIKGGDNAISYITISSQGNAQDFGDLTVQATATSACASSTRGLFSAGYNHPLYHKIIDYVTIATTGNATSFGNITISESYIYGMGGCSSSTRGLFGGGAASPNPAFQQINYVTIASLGNSQDFGDLTEGVRYPSGTSSPTRGIFAGGRDNSGNKNTISYITIATTGDATDFGDLSYKPYGQSSTSSSTRGMTVGGYNPAGDAAYDNIDYITIASTGNTQDFGNLTVARGGLAATSNTVRGTFAGGSTAPSSTNHIDYVTIASTGDALDFGDLTSSSNDNSALSDSHGGIS